MFEARTKKIGSSHGLRCLHENDPHLCKGAAVACRGRRLSSRLEISSSPRSPRPYGEHHHLPIQGIYLSLPRYRFLQAPRGLRGGNTHEQGEEEEHGNGNGTEKTQRALVRQASRLRSSRRGA